MLAVFENICKHCIAFPIGAVFCKADLNIKVTVSVLQSPGSTESRQKLPGASAFLLEFFADNCGKVGANFVFHDFRTRFKHSR